MKNDTIKSTDKIVMARYVSGVSSSQKDKDGIFAEAEQIYDHGFGYNNVDKANNKAILTPETKTDGLDQSTVNWAIKKNIKDLSEKVSSVMDSSNLKFKNAYIKYQQNTNVEDYIKYFDTDKLYNGNVFKFLNVQKPILYFKSSGGKYINTTNCPKVYCATSSGNIDTSHVELTNNCEWIPVGKEYDNVTGEVMCKLAALVLPSGIEHDIVIILSDENVLTARTDKRFGISLNSNIATEDAGPNGIQKITMYVGQQQVLTPHVIAAYNSGLDVPVDDYFYWRFQGINNSSVTSVPTGGIVLNTEDVENPSIQTNLEDGEYTKAKKLSIKATTPCTYRIYFKNNTEVGSYVNVVEINVLDKISNITINSPYIKSSKYIVSAKEWANTRQYSFNLYCDAGYKFNTNNFLSSWINTNKVTVDYMDNDASCTVTIIKESLLGNDVTITTTDNDLIQSQI